MYCGACRTLTKDFASKVSVIVNHLLLASDVKPKSEKDRLKEILPALCRPNDPEPKVCLLTTCSVVCKINITMQTFHLTVGFYLPFQIVIGSDAAIHVFTNLTRFDPIL